jgi:hypothetical protein
MAHSPSSNCHYLKFNNTCREYFDGICYWCPNQVPQCAPFSCDSNEPFIGGMILITPLIFVLSFLTCMLIFSVSNCLYNNIKRRKYMEIV